MQKDLYNRLLEFELDNDIFDTSEYDRTIEHVKEELKTPKDIKQYIDWFREGDAILLQRLKMFEQQRERLEAQIAQLQKYMNKINYKISLYAEAVHLGSLEKAMNEPEMQKNKVKLFK